MTKKQDKKQQQKRIANLAKQQEFEDLETFEKFLRDEKEDNEFNHCHAHINYIPPFVMHESHNDPEKIKDSQNRKNKKFVRHLHQHVEKHLLKEIVENSGLQLKFGKPQIMEDFDTLQWKYVDDGDHGLGEEFEHFTVEVDVKCNSNGAAIDVNYNTNVKEMESAV
ncbi:hypothetical protein WICPIJ_008465 [Wickerhamomyces pijperi]|uniref:Respiratory growth induced protein 1 n=1 Tax=Wickerhamomyces pijperi TaxID=599730 RepID=A0A9P8PZ82_WICPI|nr:hypothetical protein WICPIJ_008465 [Wickerhamomyces pijperi]